MRQGCKSGIPVLRISPDFHRFEVQFEEICMAGGDAFSEGRADIFHIIFAEDAEKLSDEDHVCECRGAVFARKAGCSPGL